MELPPPLLASEGAASICIYVYLQYLEIVFVSGSMLKKKKNRRETDASQAPSFGQFRPFFGS